MSDQPTKEQIHDFLFSNLIMQYQQMAWIGLGKLKDPTTDKIERELPQAKFAIDILETLRAKTEGNLKKEEEAFLTRTVSELQLNYVDELKKDQQASAEEKQPETEESNEQDEKAKDESASEEPNA